ncbi:hypothetical protein LEP1GSC161_2493 [Leptospira santarosai str. CBC1416]|uniref:Uncharacterized protein n=2 Tax=Leptospira santarosai TaxID=28183 RepID=K8Y4Y9_9LEPT|nr:hypothetical protein [Leptospira santarosai]EMM86636.1 hypothetical protein LEP1GSC039_3600 [Leptospira santarosai str. 2000027870]EMO56892.1 hypothetical protein LEP1GSC161_2493 [Leptospira santarosai str. CBC1416]EPG81945.1 hypothetical protein LEP1GSC048_0302 [Leptospira santarosai serovar Shermani str. 1342KT]EKT88678.1 hypothetical protein LSS_01194 [Leptospira santarosai serovar Shermani str. LT 821]MDI7203800.1 hypothetical protein [Leptospira santarosai]
MGHAVNKYENLNRAEFLKKQRGKKMSKLLCVVTILILGTGCFTIGKVGYISPATYDTGELAEEVIAEDCSFTVTNILNDMNRALVNKGKSDVTNVGLKFTRTNCAQTRSLK